MRCSSCEEGSREGSSSSGIEDTLNLVAAPGPPRKEDLLLRKLLGAARALMVAQSAWGGEASGPGGGGLLGVCVLWCVCIMVCVYYRVCVVGVCNGTIMGMCGNAFGLVDIQVQ